MKKIFTLATGLLISAVMFAADRRPSVTVTSSKKYQIVIDGKAISSGYASSVSIDGLRQGFHNIKVYQLNKFMFLSNKKLVASSGFQVGDCDVNIQVDRFGQIDVSQSASNNWNKNDDRGFGKNDRGFKNDKNYHQPKGRDDHDRRF